MKKLRPGENKELPVSHNYRESWDLLLSTGTSFFKIYLFIYLFIFVCVGSLVLCAVFL